MNRSSPHVGLLCAVLLILAVGCRAKNKEPTPISTSPSSPSPSHPTAKSSAPELNLPPEHIETNIDLNDLYDAISLFQRREERSPESFDELVFKKYLKTIPKAPTGRKYHYNKSDGQIYIVPE
jgi:hypothetical protein